MKFSLQGVLFLLAMLGLLAASYFMVFQKADARRAAIETDIQTKQRALAELERSNFSTGDVTSKVAELQKAVSFFESKLPQAKEVDKILKDIWQKADANSLQTKTIKTPKSQRTATYSEQPVEMTLSGDFNGFYAFLLELENLPRLSRVPQMKLQKISNHDGEMQAQLTLSIFFEPDTDTQTAAAQ